MQTEISTQLNEPVDQIAEVKMTTDLINQNVNAGADKLQKGLEIIFGPNSKKYGLTSTNLKLAFMFYGVFLAYPHMKDFIIGNESKKTKAHWKQVLGAVALIMTTRKVLESQNSNKVL